MTRKFSQLMRIEHDHKICKDTYYKAYYHIEHGLLLALRESGTLSDMQYRLVIQALKQQ